MSIHIKDPEQAAKGCVIWMHGLGADAGDMIGLVNELQISIPLRHVFLDAPIRPVTLNNGMPMRAWYDITGMKLTDREDRDGILESEALIRKVIKKQMSDGFSPETIFLAGFSQGGAMALHTGLHTEGALAGLIVLSGYLPLASEAQLNLDVNTPLFFASGEFDPMVLPAWTGECVTHLQEHGYQHLTWHRYPMDHSICIEEVRDLQQWISSALTNEALK